MAPARINARALALLCAWPTDVSLPKQGLLVDLQLHRQPWFSSHASCSFRSSHIANSPSRSAPRCSNAGLTNSPCHHQAQTKDQRTSHGRQAVCTLDQPPASPQIAPRLLHGSRAYTHRTRLSPGMAHLDCTLGFLHFEPPAHKVFLLRLFIVPDSPP